MRLSGCLLLFSPLRPLHFLKPQPSHSPPCHPASKLALIPFQFPVEPIYGVCNIPSFAKSKWTRKIAELEKKALWCHTDYFHLLLEKRFSWVLDILQARGSFRRFHQKTASHTTTRTQQCLTAKRAHTPS